MSSQLFCSLAVPEFVDLVPCANLTTTRGTGQLSAAFPRSMAESLPFHPALCSVAKSVYVAREQDKALNLSRLFPRGFFSERRFSREGKECLVVLYQLVPHQEQLDLTLRYQGESFWDPHTDSTISVRENLFCQQFDSYVRVSGHGEVVFAYGSGEMYTLTFTSTYSGHKALYGESYCLGRSHNFHQRRVTDIVCRSTEELFLCEYESSIHLVPSSMDCTGDYELEPCTTDAHALYS